MINQLSILKKFLCQFYQIPDNEWEFIMDKIEYRKFHKK